MTLIKFRHPFQHIRSLIPNERRGDRSRPTGVRQDRRRRRVLALEHLESRRLLAHEPIPLRDINPSGPLDSSYPAEFTFAGGTTYFQATDRTHGAELWQTDGTAAGTVLAGDLVPGIASSSPTNLTNAAETLFYLAHTPSTGSELYRIGGMVPGISLVKDILPGSRDGIPALLYEDGLYDHLRLTAVQGMLCFVADDGVHGLELWTSDGTEAGTKMVTELFTGRNTFDYPKNLTNYDRRLFFSATTFTANPTSNVALWASDGTATGTTLIKAIPSRPDAYGLSAFTVVQDRLFFAYGPELWVSDGTPEGTSPVQAFPGHLVRSLTAVDGRLFFGLSDSGLWSSDGTPEGTQLIAAIDVSTIATSMVAVNGQLFFAGNDAEHGVELWKSDGTPGGTALVSDIYPGRSMFVNSSQPLGLVNADGVLFFTAKDAAHGREVWTSDGTEGGTVLVKDIRPGTWGSDGSDVKPQDLRFLDGKLYFDANDGVTGNEPWVLTLNDPPIISDIPDQNTSLSTPTPPIAFTVNDPETPPDALQVTATSSNTTLVPNENIVGGGTGTNRFVTITPVSNLYGSTTITVVVTDEKSAIAADTFVLTVADKTPPTPPAVVEMRDDTGMSQADRLTSDITPTFTWTAADDSGGSDLAGYLWSVDNANLGTDGTFTASLAATPTVTANGFHTFYVRAVDGAGNLSSPISQFGFTIDTVAPRVAAMSIADGAQLDTPPRYLTVDFSEPMDLSAGHLLTGDLIVHGAAAKTVSVISAEWIDQDTTRFGIVGIWENGDLQMQLAPGHIRDAAGNPLGIEAGHLALLLMPDSDGDGLYDQWERSGIDVDGDAVPEINLSALGADPYRKDIFIEVDSMAGLKPIDLPDHPAPPPAHLRTNTALDLVITAYLAAPVANPAHDGISEPNGISLHIDLQEDDLPRVPWDTPKDVGWPPAFDTFKRDHFGTGAERDSLMTLAAKKRVFRYAVFADSYKGSHSGLGELGGNDFMVTLGTWRSVSADIQAGTFMHELGHTLGLHHGGGDSVNCKPNYHSVMNYTWQMPHAVAASSSAAEQAFAKSWRLDYSRGNLLTLDEYALDELGGIGGDPAFVVPIRESWTGALSFVKEGGWADFDRDQSWDSTPVQANLNGLANCGPDAWETLFDHND